MEFYYDVMFGMDKQMHLFSYGVISLLVGIVVVIMSKNQTVKQRISVAWVVLVTVGTVEEYRQYMIPNRSAEFLDAIANLLGITVGLAVPLLVLYMIKYRNRFVFKLFAVYSIILVPLLLGLIYFNQRPFVILEEPTRENLQNLLAIVGL
ncbi:VanZ family protein [Paraliobacillus sediminis]|uniref:VanZ family protein n=1 Tax=Paraliobacillus sediminis TaxID=1885916 RepID=UPI000E3E4805|nr:VanZ family protein [Paraliobacillus sediminis]